MTEWVTAKTIASLSFLSERHIHNLRRDGILKNWKTASKPGALRSTYSFHLEKTIKEIDNYLGDERKTKWVTAKTICKRYSMSQRHLHNLRENGVLSQGTHWIKVGSRSNYRFHIDKTIETLDNYWRWK